MFEIHVNSDREIRLSGRFDATQVETASSIFDEINESSEVNFNDLDYISSAGLSVLLKVQKRLRDNNRELVLKNMNPHIREVFKYAGFDMIFAIK